MKSQINKILLCEFLGSATVLIGIVGIGVNSNPYLPNPAIQMITVVVAVAILISAAWLLFNRVCPVQLNPLLTLSLMARRRIDVANGTEQIAAQVVGALTGVVIGNYIFGLEPFSPADQDFIGLNRFIGEFVVSIGVMLLSLLLFEKTYLPFTGAIIPFWVILVSALSGSASFANPAISVANSLSHTVTSEPTSALLGLLASQLLGGIVGFGLAWAFKFRHEPAPSTFTSR